MNPRRLHSDAMRSIKAISFGSDIGLASVCELHQKINPEARGHTFNFLTLSPNPGLEISAGLTADPPFNPKGELERVKMWQDAGAEILWKDRSPTRSGLVRFFQSVCAQ